jgi:hypothetical protein
VGPEILIVRSFYWALVSLNTFKLTHPNTVLDKVSLTLSPHRSLLD